MAMPHTAHDWTVERVLSLPDDGTRYEAVDGELLVTPAPSRQHQQAVVALVVRFEPFVRKIGLGKLGIAPADIELDDQTLVQPDLFIFERPGAGDSGHWRDVRTILLAVEVLSPSSARADRLLKRRRYQRHGIPEYWIVDLDARLVERWQPTDDRPEVLTERIAWRPDPAGPSLTLDLADFFAEVLDR